ncbi:MAG: hypothetical protein F6K35_26165 [Okeania sp. SIO2H7]|nr:hypothetical protein [Okeania sp. SIO2H7]
MINNRIIEQLKILENLSKADGGSELLERSLAKIIDYEIALAKQQAAELEAELQEFERRYKMRSPEFYQRFKNGELGDDIDFVEWSSFYKMKLSLEKRLGVLEGKITDASR